MYLLTFAFLVIAMLGIYTQVYAVAVTRMLAGETIMADTMITWHEAAASLAGNVMNTTATPLTLAGCSLTGGIAVPPSCLLGPASAGPATGIVTVAAGAPAYSSPPGVIFYPQLPGSYNFGPYQWRSIAYQPTPTQYYVITWVPPPVPASGNITSATGAPINITQSDLFRQIKHTFLPTTAYGYVSGGLLLTTATTPAGVPITYPVPTTAAGVLEVPNNSIAIISFPGYCSGC